MNLNSKFTALLEEELPFEITKAAPSVHLQAFHQGKLTLDYNAGKEYEIYDWASLTKPVFTVSAMMRVWDDDHKILDRKVSEFLPWYPFKTLLIRDLLRHKSGLLWWVPFFKRLKEKSNSEKREGLKKYFVKHGPVATKKTVYSDLDFILLGFILEEIWKKDLDKIWEELRKDFGLKKTTFHSENKPSYSRSKYAPTEKSGWRGKTLTGEVHDDNTWSWGGVSSHAGLFGPMDDLAKWALEFRKGHRGGRNAIASSNAIQLFSKRAVPQAQGDWAMGMMIPAKKNSLAGKYFSPQSVGHWGFTGTSWWFDPKRDLIVLILSNRVHPSRRNKKFAVARPILHDVVWKTLKGIS